MELTVMAINVQSKYVVTAEGVEITAEGLAQVRIDPGMAEDQADAMLSARNENIEHQVEEIIREKTLYNKAKQEEETIKGVPGVTMVKVVTISSAYDPLGSVAKDITPGKKRLAAFVGPPGKGVTQKVFAECHRRLKESGMVPYWVKEMPQSADLVTFEACLLKLNGGVVPTRSEMEEKHLGIEAAEQAFGKLTYADHPKRKNVYDV
eukprot:COSAG06_NODE_3265_length_5594_cov_4.359054_3_plen_207_part_00